MKWKLSTNLIEFSDLTMNCKVKTGHKNPVFFIRMSQIVIIP